MIDTGYKSDLKKNIYLDIEFRAGSLNQCAAYSEPIVKAAYLIEIFKKSSHLPLPVSL